MLPRVDLPKFRWQVLLKCRYLHGVTSQKTSDITCAIALCLKWDEKAHSFEAAWSNTLLYTPEATIWRSHRSNYVYSWYGATEARLLGLWETAYCGDIASQLILQGSSEDIVYRTTNKRKYARFEVLTARQLKIQGKDEAVPLHTTKVYRGRWGTAPRILNLGIGWGRVVNFTPRPLYPWERKQVPIVQGARWAPGMVRKCRSEQIPSVPARIRNQERPARGPVTQVWPKTVTCSTLLVKYSPTDMA